MGTAEDAKIMMDMQAGRFKTIQSDMADSIAYMTQHIVDEMFSDWYRWNDFIQAQWLFAGAPFSNMDKKTRTPFNSNIPFSFKPIQLRWWWIL